MFLVSKEKKRWAIGCFNCHGEMFYIYPIRTEIEKKIFQDGKVFETVEEIFNYLEKEWKR